MFMQDVSSKALAAIGVEADPGTQDSLTVRIRFHSGKEYDYAGVSQEDYDALMNAASIGNHFMTVFKKIYTGVLV